MKKPGIEFLEKEIVWEAVRSRGAGGQNVNKVATAVRIRFDIGASSLPEPVKMRLLRSHDSRIGADGVISIRSEIHRTQERNRAEAVSRLERLVGQAYEVPARRIPTRPTKASIRRIKEQKSRRSVLKKSRQKVTGTD